jgi:DNA invertase Pin-like site-specific DNA recombinase
MERYCSGCLPAGLEAEMQKQSGKSVALYFRTATRETSGQHLDNQMQRLLCYTRENSLDSFILYADHGASGLTLDRPAMSALRADIKAGRISEIIVTDISRIGRVIVPVRSFIRWAQSRGVRFTSIADGTGFATIIGLIDAAASFLDGGEVA